MELGLKSRIPTASRLHWVASRLDLESTPKYARVDSPYDAINLESTPNYVRVDSPMSQL